MKTRIILVLLTITLILSSCATNQEMKDKVFGNSNWKNDLSGQFYDNLRFGDDDTVTMDQPAISTTNVRYWYKFKQDGSGFYLAHEQSQYFFKIISSSNTNVSLENNQSIINLHRQ